MADRGATPVLDREAARQTVIWGLGLSFLTKFASVGLSIVLARLIAPELFGQYGTVSAAILLIMSFSMQPFANHLFHQRSPGPEDFHRHLAFGSLLHLALFALANALALGMRFSATLSQVAGYVHIGSLAILINVPRIYYATYLRMELRWKAMRFLGLLSFALYAAASITLALMGHGVLALLAQNLVAPLPFVAALCFDTKTLRGFNLDWRGYRDALRFGLARTSSGVLYQGQVALENYVLTLSAGFGPLGIFLRARGLAQLATTWLTEQVNAILYPSVAKLEPRSPQARRAAGVLMRLGFWTTAPLVVAGAVAGEAVITVLYGRRWAPAGEFLPPLLVAALAISQVGIAKMVVLTSDGARRTLALDLVGAAINVAGLLVLWTLGLQAYASYLAGGNLLYLAGVLALMVRTGLIAGDDVFRTFAPGVSLGAVAAMLLAVGGRGFLDAMPQLAALVVVGLWAACVMLLLVRLLDRRGLETACDLIPFGGHIRPWLGLGAMAR